MRNKTFKTPRRIKYTWDGYIELEYNKVREKNPEVLIIRVR